MIPICLPCLSLLIVLPKPELQRQYRCVVCKCVLYSNGPEQRR